MSRICLTLPGPDHHTNRRMLREYSGCYAAFELRLDLLDSPDPEAIVGFFSSLFSSEQLTAPLETHGDIDFSVILTLRRPEDGGRFSGSSRDTEDFFIGLLELLSHGDFWPQLSGKLAVDVERQSPVPGLDRYLAKRSITRIRSAHDFIRCPGNIPEQLEELAEGGAVPKLALMPAGLADVDRIFAGGRRFADGDTRTPFILLGMGEFGLPTRILPEFCGSHISYAAPGGELAPGQMDCRILAEHFRSRSPDLNTRVFAIVGNPVAHSISPGFHNARFREAGAEAVYIPLLCDDPAALPALGSSMGLTGMSVTIPYKEAVRGFLDWEDPAVDAIGACNTVVRDAGGRWLGYNSDVHGFLAPIAGLVSSAGDHGSHDAAVRDTRRATVIGAGGAARAACYGLLESGWEILILNRSAQRLGELAKDLDIRYPGRVKTAPLSSESSGLLRNYRRLIVQTSPLGMTGKAEGDPLSFYDFTGDETVYDMIYTPPKTPILARAEAAGCRIINGEGMFEAQAAVQSRLFLEALKSG
jgi:3-dehydroquinate dehydratase/shikimate dehydrogenase